MSLLPLNAQLTSGNFDRVLPASGCTVSGDGGGGEGVCAVASCIHHTQRPCPVPLVDFPSPVSDRRRCAQWMQACGVRHLQPGLTRLCVRHFDVADFVVADAGAAAAALAASEAGDLPTSHPHLPSRRGCDVVRVHDDVIPSRQLVMNPHSWSLTADTGRQLVQSHSGAAVKSSGAGAGESGGGGGAGGGVSRRASRVRRRQRYAALVSSLMARSPCGADTGNISASTSSVTSAGTSSTTAGSGTASALDPDERAALVRQAVADYDRRHRQCSSSVSSTADSLTSLQSTTPITSASSLFSLTTSSRGAGASATGAGPRRRGHSVRGITRSSSGRRACRYMASRVVTAASQRHAASDSSAPVPLPSSQPVGDSSADHCPAVGHSFRRSEMFTGSESHFNDNDSNVDAECYLDDRTSATPERVLNINLIVQKEDVCAQRRATNADAVPLPATADVERPVSSAQVSAPPDQCVESQSPPPSPRSPSTSDGDLLDSDDSDGALCDGAALEQNWTCSTPLPASVYTRDQLLYWLNQSVSSVPPLPTPQLGAGLSRGRGRGGRSRTARSRAGCHSTPRAGMTLSSGASSSSLLADSLSHPMMSPPPPATSSATSSAAAAAVAAAADSCVFDESVRRMPYWMTDRSRELLRWKRHLQQLQLSVDLETEHRHLSAPPFTSQSQQSAVGDHNCPATTTAADSASTTATPDTAGSERTCAPPLLTLRDSEPDPVSSHATTSSSSLTPSMLLSYAELPLSPSTLVNALSLLHRQRLLCLQLCSALLLSERRCRRLQSAATQSSTAAAATTTDAESNSVPGDGQWSDVDIARAVELRRLCTASVYGYVRNMYGDGRIPGLATLALLTSSGSAAAAAGARAASQVPTSPAHGRHRHTDYYRPGRQQQQEQSQRQTSLRVLSDTIADSADDPPCVDVDGLVVCPSHQPSSSEDRLERAAGLRVTDLRDPDSLRVIDPSAEPAADSPLWECLGEYVDGCGGILPVAMPGVATSGTSLGGRVPKRRHRSLESVGPGECDVVWSDAAMLPDRVVGVKSRHPSALEHKMDPLTSVELCGSSSRSGARRRRLDAVGPQEEPERIGVAGTECPEPDLTPTAVPLGSPQWLTGVAFSNVPIENGN